MGFVGVGDIGVDSVGGVAIGMDVAGCCGGVGVVVVDVGGDVVVVVAVCIVCDGVADMRVWDGKCAVDVADIGGGIGVADGGVAVGDVVICVGVVVRCG